MQLLRSGSRTASLTSVADSVHRSIWTEAPLGNAANSIKFMNNSLVRESPEMDKIRKAVKDAGIMVVLGYSERDGHSLYQAQVDPSSLCMWPIPGVKH